MSVHACRRKSAVPPELCHVMGLQGKPNSINGAEGSRYYCEFAKSPTPARAISSIHTGLSYSKVSSPPMRNLKLRAKPMLLVVNGQ